jgi:hypothetical protein
MSSPAVYREEYITQKRKGKVFFFRFGRRKEKESLKKEEKKLKAAFGKWFPAGA